MIKTYARTITSLVVSIVLMTPIVAIAAPLYAPGQTLDPSCLPTNVDCTVISPATAFGTNPFQAATFQATSTAATSTFGNISLATGSSIAVGNTTFLDSNGNLNANVLNLSDTYANLASVVLGQGQIAYASDTKAAYIGDGSNSVSNLSQLNPLYYSTGTGQYGLGTTNPTSFFTVAGTTTLTALRTSRIDTGTGDGETFDGSPLNIFTTADIDNGIGGDITIKPSKGVAGLVPAGNLYLYDGQKEGGQTSGVYLDDWGGNGIFLDSSSTVSFQRYGGKVGIGSTTPVATLGVSGSAYFGGSLTATGTLTVSNTATSTFSGPIKATCFSTDGTTCITGGGGGSLSGGVTNALAYWTSSSAIGATTSPYVNNLNASGTLSVGNSYVTASGQNSFASGLSSGSGYTISASGRGTIAVGEVENAAGGGGGSIEASNNGTFAGGHVASVFGTGGTITSSGLGTFAFGNVSGTGFSVSAAGEGSVAMGDALNGNISAPGSPSFAFGDNITANGSVSFAFGSGFTNTTSNSFMVGFGSTPSLTVLSSKVGIGTSSPATILDIAKNSGTASTTITMEGHIQFYSVQDNICAWLDASGWHQKTGTCTN